MGLDIGPEAIKQFEEALKGSKVRSLSHMSLTFLKLCSYYYPADEVIRASKASVSWFHQVIATCIMLADM